MILLLATAQALPMYAQRSGRTCGNCHVSPTLEDEEGWDNPALMKRKCTMTCVSCHTDPTGGGLRNTSGRYYGLSTLGIVPLQDRSYSDLDREWLSSDTIWRLQQKLSRPPKGEGRTVPSDREDVEAGMGQGQTGNLFAHGRHGQTTTMAYWDGRYANLNADPVLQVGGDLRFAYYTGTGKVFPMQLDLHASVHPVHHLTIAATGAFQPIGSEGAPVFARRAYVMAHELPGMSWAKLGAFQPAFGTLIDDHTSPIRTLFEGSQADSGNTVLGAEIGTAPNYPFAQLSVFANDARYVGAAPDTGYGAALQAGWRDLDWSLTGHAQVRRRGREGKGDLEAIGLGWALAPRFAWKPLPITWLGEATVGRRAIGTDISAPFAAMSELSFLIRNGLVAKLRTDVWSVRVGSEGLSQRHGVGAVITPFPGLSLEGTARMLVTPKGTLRADYLAQAHIWF